MYLSTKQLALLLSPLVLAFLVFFFNEDIIGNVRILFPDYTVYTNKEIEKKASIYLKIESKNDTYQSILNKIKQRQEYAQWIVDNLLYNKNVTKVKKTRKVYKKRVRKIDFRKLKLKAVYPKDKVAIINGKIVKKNRYISGVKLLEVTPEGVLLGRGSEKAWVYLFQ